MAEVVQADKRESFGKHHTRRLRRAGKLPAVLYGHGEGTVCLTLDGEGVARALRHGEKLLELTGSVQESAVIKEMQWNPFGTDVLHMDLMRVSAGERLEVEVPVETRGEAPGVKEGGIVSIVVHTVEIETTPGEIPEVLHLNINRLQLDETLAAKDIEDMPAQAKLMTDPETVLVQCVAPLEEEKEEEAGAEAEPEIIGRKAEDEEGGEG